MVQHDIVPNPLNYTLWYTYFSDSFPALNAALDDTVKRYGTCPADISETLFLEHISKHTDSVNDNNEIQQALVHLVGDLSNQIADTVSQTHMYSDALKEDLMAIGTSGLDDDLAEKLNQLSANANGICNANDAFQSQLASAQSEIDSLKQALQKSELQATTDALTGLSNRRVFETIYDEFSKEQQPLAIVMIDIDKFKVFNDTHGHVMGDQILQFVGKLLKKECPDNVTPVRFGGEEFALLCPQLPLNEVTSIAENIRRKLEKVSFSNKRTGKKIEPVTASFGIAIKQASDELLESLVERADKALYQAKSSGRNQVKLAS